MRSFVFASVALVAIVLPATAARPVLVPGTCTYLVGAPAGATAATSEERVDGIRIAPLCLNVHEVGTRGGGHENSVQIYMETSGRASGNDSCLASAWVGHEFLVGGEGQAVRARIDVAGGVEGMLNLAEFYSGGMRLEVVVLEVDPLRDVLEVVYRGPIVVRELPTFNLELDESFGATGEVMLVPGRAYRAVMELTVTVPAGGFHVDLGPPGTGSGAWYDSIEVCIDASDDGGAAVRLDAIALADLEHRLYEKQCAPGTWMPAAQGGRLEAARQLVADRIPQAVATGDPNVNERVATQKLAAADADIAARQYQRACRNLSDSLRALTTP